MDENALTQGGVPPKPDEERYHGLVGKCYVLQNRKTHQSGLGLLEYGR